MPIKQRRRDVDIRVQRRDLGAQIANEFGPVRMRTIVRKSNQAGDDGEVIEQMDALSIDMSNFRETTWECSMSIERDVARFQPLKDWIKVGVEVMMLNGEWRLYPKGIYRFTEQAGTINRAQEKWDLQGYSGDIILHIDGPRGSYSVPKDTNILSKVKEIIVNQGFSDNQVIFPFEDDKTTKKPLIFDPFEDESKGTWLRICNKLLGMGGFHALWVDERGRFRTDQLRDIRAQKPVVHYGPRGDQEPIILDGVSEQWGMENFCNMVIVTSEDPRQLPPIWAIAKNDDPNSDSSYQALGKRWVKRRIKKEHIADQEAAQKIADRNLEAGSSFEHGLSYATPPDPERGLKEYHYMTIPIKGDEDIDSVFRNIGWAWDLYPQPQEMQFESARRHRV